MVIKLLRSSSPGNLISYLLGGGHDQVDNRAKIITGNFIDIGASKEDITKEFTAYTGESKLKHPCFHCIVSLPPGERLSENQIHELVQDIEKALKMEDYPYLAVQHLEKDHQHFHIAIDRPSPLHNKVLHDPFSYRVLTKLAREKERQWGLRELNDPFCKKAFIRNDKRKAAIRHHVRESLAKATNYEDLVRELKGRGITVFKQRGISFSDGVIRVKGSDPHINYSLGQIQYLLKSKQESSGQVVSGKQSTDSIKGLSPSMDNHIEPRRNSDLGLVDMLSGIGQDLNQVAPSASPRRGGDEEDEEYWKKKKRKKRRFY